MSTTITPTLSVSNDQNNAAEKVDVSDFASLRLPPDFEREAGVRKQITTVRSRKPRRQEWIRVHADPEYRGRFAMLEWKESDDSRAESYVILAGAAKQLSPDEYHRATIFLACNRQGDFFLWPCRDPREDSKMGRDTAAITRIQAAEAAMERQVRVQWRSPAFEVSFRNDSIPDVEPVWPDKTLDELVEIAFGRTGMVIRDLNHPVIRILQGRS